MPSTWISRATWTIIRDELLWRSWLTKMPLLNSSQQPAAGLWCSAAWAAMLQLSYRREKQLCADFIIIMIYYYDPSQSKQSAEPQ